MNEREVSLDPQSFATLQSIAAAVESMAESLAAIAEAVSHPPRRVMLGPSQTPNEFPEGALVVLKPEANPPFSRTGDDVNDPMEHETAYVVHEERLDKDGDVILKKPGGGFFWVRPDYLERIEG